MNKDEIREAAKAMIGGRVSDMSTEDLKRLLAVTHLVGEICLTELVLKRKENDVMPVPSMLFHTEVQLALEKARAEAA